MTLSAILRKSPFARFLACYMAGILYVSLLDPACSRISTSAIYVISAVFCLLLLLVMRSPGYFTNHVTAIISGFILFFAGFLNMSLHYEFGKQARETTGFKGYVLMEIAEPPVIKENVVTTTAIIRSRHENMVWFSDKQRIQVSFKRDNKASMLSMGMLILTRVYLRGIDPPGNPREFNYQQYLVRRHIYNRTYIPAGQWKAIRNPVRSTPRVMAYQMQQRLLKAYQKIGLNHTLYGLLSAITLGYKSDLEARTEQIFSQAGVMHVMALSGFNVAIIALAMGYLLFFTGWFKWGKIIKTAIIVTTIWIFAFITGLSPSVTRASVMITFILAGQLFQRRINTYNILFLSAFVLLAHSPAMVYDVSFQLSFAAVLGILMFYQPLYGMLSCSNFVINKLWQLFSVSCAAQLSTLPLTIYYFHQFPVYFWLTNMYVVPLVSLIICMSGLYLVCSFVQPLMLISGKALAVLLTLLYKSVAFTEVLPGSLLENLYINDLQVWLLIIMIVFTGFFLVHLKTGFLILALTLMVLFQVITMRHYAGLNHQKVILVGNVKGISTINLISGRNCLLLCDSAMSQNHPVLRYAFDNFWTERGVSDKVSTIAWGSNAFFSFAGTRVAVLNDNNLYRRSADKPIRIDLLIVNGNVKPEPHLLTRFLQPEVIILSSSVNAYQATQWLEAGKVLGSTVWNVAEKGAYLLNCR